MIVDSAPAVRGIYIIRNKISANAYIGQARNIRKRLRHHRWSLTTGVHKNPHFQAAWNKYGADAFEWDVICTCNEEQYLNIVEGALLSGNATMAGVKRLYNAAKTPGAVMTGRRHTEESRRRMSERRKAFRYTDDQKRVICEVQRQRQLARPGYAERVIGFFDAVRGGVDPVRALKLNGFDAKRANVDRLFRQYGDLNHGHRTD